MSNSSIEDLYIGEILNKGEMSHRDCCNMDHWTWEINIVIPALLTLGYHFPFGRHFSTGDHDSFGPLERHIIVSKNNMMYRVWYG